MEGHEPLQPQDPAHPNPQWEYASVLTRFGAMVIDYVLGFAILIPIFLTIAIFGEGGEGDGQIPGLLVIIMLGTFLGFFGFFIWNTIIRMGKTGQSLGRKYLNIAVLTNEGKPIGIGYAAFREIVGRYISGLVCYIGYLNAFWDKDKQMWHDKMAECYVYYVEDNFS